MHYYTIHPIVMKLWEVIEYTTGAYIWKSTERNLIFLNRLAEPRKSFYIRLRTINWKGEKEENVFLRVIITTLEPLNLWV